MHEATLEKTLRMLDISVQTLYILFASQETQGNAPRQGEM